MDAADGAALRVRQLTQSLADRLNAQDACRTVIGLIYLRNRAWDQPTDIWGRGGGPSWPWLVAQTTRSQPLGPRVQECLTAWLPAGLGPDGADARRDFIPSLPATVDGHLREMINAIDHVDRVGDLLEQCLEDLSDAQAKGGHYFTPRDIARLLVEAVDPHDGQRVLDPVCGSAGLLVEAGRHVRERTGLRPNLELTGRDLHAGTLRIAQLNLAAQGIEADLGASPVDSLAWPAESEYDIVLANPPFNMAPWGPRTLRSGDPRWPGQVQPPRDNANFAWILHFAQALAPQGRAAFLMADGAATGARPAEQRIRAQLVRDDLVESVVALPPGIFPHTRNSACLWLLNRDKSPHRGWGSEDRRGQFLFIDARRAKELVPDTRQWRLAPDGVRRILDTLAAWRGSVLGGGERPHSYEDEPGWCGSRSTEEIAKQEYDLLPLTYASEPENGGPAGQYLVEALREALYDKFSRAHVLERELRRILDEL
ncbi:N-6 DNA methylase [Streptomyces sp. NPDC091215]|uniref:N-6 DNA methylase n=1 Tax=Streptomyces sp. NPDC091215 TaxID=3155192 RepID=UPI003427C36F